MNDYLEENYQNQIFQSFAKNINDEPQKVTNSSSKKENIEFTFKKLIFGSNKNKEMEKEFENNIYSKNDKNIKQSGHFFNEIKNESKYKQLLKNDKGKNNLIKPLFKFIEHKKIKLKRLKINKINKKIFIKTLENMQKSRMTTIGTNYLKRDFNFNSKNDKKAQGNNQINSTTYINNTNNISNITNFNNNSKFIINFVTQTPLNTFLEISHDSHFENNDNKNENVNSNKENINLNINKDNYKIDNNKVNDYERIFNKNKKIPDKIYNKDSINLIMNKDEEKKNSLNVNLNTIHTTKTRNKPKNKKEKYDKNISFDIVKSEYKELKQKIFENKLKKKANKLNKGYLIKNNPEKKMSTNKSSICNKRMNKFNQANLSTTTYFKKNIRQKAIKNLKINKISFISSYNSFNNENDLFNTHRRMKSIASNYLSK